MSAAEPRVDSDAIIDAATRAATPTAVSPGDIISVVVPGDSRHDIIDLEQYLDAPKRKRGRVQLFTTDSLATYINAYKDDAALYADVEHVQIVAILNGHVPGDGIAGWGDHRATFTARLTPEWQAWAAIDGRYLAQPQFAEFLEDHAADVVNPPAADLLELAKTFEATARAEFKSGIRLDNGTRQLQYVETIDAKAGQQGQIVIPETVELGVSPFEGADAYRVLARFRYRLESGALKLGIVLDRPDRVLRDAFDAVLGEVESATALKAYRGTPPVG